MKSVILSALCLLITTCAFAKVNFLEKCLQKQGGSLERKFLTLSYTETIHRLYHSMSPWQTYTSAPHGKLFLNENQLLKFDTLKGKKSDYFARTQFDSFVLFMTDFGDTSLISVRQRDILEYTFESARYNPLLLINYFYRNNILPQKESNSEFAIYQTRIGKTIVRLCIRKENFLAEKVTMLAGEEILGDVENVFLYRGYAVAGGIDYPKTIYIQKINGMVNDTVSITQATIDSLTPSLLKKPENFAVKPEGAISDDSITVEKFSDHLHFVHFKHADSKALIAEFDSFLVVAESPLTSANGEMLIQAAHQIAPQKQIRYFTYGHWHPWYLGGVRPFIYHGTTIVCAECDSEYVKYLAAAKHTLEPDSLELYPKVLSMEMFHDSLTISDTKYSMVIYLIGKASDHTLDYSIFYFPQEKMLFEGDLAWIKKDAAPAKASSRQAGLYNAIKARHLDVTTIVQACPVEKYGLKSVFGFAELERAMEVK